VRASAYEQDGLEKHHAGIPDRGGTAEERKRHPRNDGLHEKQERRSEERGEDEDGARLFESTYLGSLKLRHFGGARESLEPAFVDDGARVIPMFNSDGAGAAFEIQTHIINFTGGRLDFQQ